MILKLLRKNLNSNNKEVEMMKGLKLLLIATIVTSCSTYSPLMATSNPTGPRKGESCAKFVLGFNTSGIEMIADAAFEGNIKRISTVDRKTSGFFPFVWTKCTVVTGN